MKLTVKGEYTLIELYESVAQLMGHENAKGVSFDCTKINVAPNLQDGFYNEYMRFVKETDPSVSEADARAEVTMLLAACGPKVDEHLAPNEVEVFDGFIC